tara:strand:- start:52 stop:642 length:591 start_codon:yes stop_codon:yes gene_type:complete
LVAGSHRVLGKEVDGLITAVLGVHGSPVVATLLVIVHIQTFNVRSGHDQNLSLFEESDMRGNGGDLNVGTIILFLSHDNLSLDLSHGSGTNSVIMINIESIGEDARQTRHRDSQEALVGGSSDMEYDGVGEHRLPGAVGAVGDLAQLLLLEEVSERVDTERGLCSGQSHTENEYHSDLHDVKAKFGKEIGKDKVGC